MPINQLQCADQQGISTLFPDWLKNPGQQQQAPSNSVEKRDERGFRYLDGYSSYPSAAAGQLPAAIYVKAEPKSFLSTTLTAVSIVASVITIAAAVKSYKSGQLPL